MRLAALLLVLPLWACTAQPEPDNNNTSSSGMASSSGGADGGNGGSSSSGGGPDICGTGTAMPDARLLPTDVRSAAADLGLRVGTNRLEFYTRDRSTLTTESLEMFQARTCAALRFNIEQMAIDTAQPALLPAVRVVILDDTAYGAATGAAGTYGVAFPPDGNDGDAIVLPESGLSNLPELDDTLAHELNHIVVDRLAPFNADFPWYFIEGLAISMGTRWGKHEHGYATGFAKGWIDNATGADATLTFQRYDLEDLTQNLQQLGHDQSISGFFVEFLIAGLPHGSSTGFPDAHVRVLGTFRSNSDGAVFDTAFANQFDAVTLANAKDAFVDFLDSTNGNPSGRYAGTVFAQ